MSEQAQDGYLVLGRQAAKGVPAVGLGNFGLKVTSKGVTGGAEAMDDPPEIGGGRDPDSSLAAMQGFTVGGDLEGLLRPKSFGLLMLGAGFVPGPPVQDGATGAYSHPWTLGALTYLTLEGRWGTTSAIRRWVDCLINELTVTVDAQGRGTWTASVLGISEEWRAAPVVPTWDTNPAAIWDGSAVSLDGLGTYRFESTEFTVSNNLAEDEFVIGSRLRDDMTPAAREVMFGGRIKVGNDDPKVTDLYRAATYGSKGATGPGTSDPYHSSGSVTFGSPRKIGTSAAVRYGVTFSVPDLVLRGFPLESSGDEPLRVDVEAKAYRGAGDICTAELRTDYPTTYAAA